MASHLRYERASAPSTYGPLISPRIRPRISPRIRPRIGPTNSPRISPLLRPRIRPTSNQLICALSAPFIGLFATVVPVVVVTVLVAVVGVSCTSGQRNPIGTAGGGDVERAQECDPIPAPDGIGCAAAVTLVDEMSAGLDGGLRDDTRLCLIDKLQDLPDDAELRMGALYDCEAFRVLGKLQQSALGLDGPNTQVDCLAQAIEGTGRDEFLAAIAAGPNSEAALLLAEDFADQCRNS